MPNNYLANDCVDMNPLKNEESKRVKVCVQGLGFVGAAKAIAIANAIDESGYCFEVCGVELPTDEGRRRAEAINLGKFPFETTDQKLIKAAQDASDRGNICALTDSDAFQEADIVVVDVPFDIDRSEGNARLLIPPFRKAIRTLAANVKPDVLIVVETTVPPGTCENIVMPELRCGLEARGLDDTSVMLAYAYERVMPGPNYYDSVVNFWRVYSGMTVEAADECKLFLEKIINVEDFPLTKVSSVTAAEIGKVLENSYRATTIAMMEEWGRFAEAVGVDLFEVIEAIRLRPTHSNMRQPGFGVGGYCLTKDPMLAELAAVEIFGRDDLKFPFSTQALKTNDVMPLTSLEKVQGLLGGSLENKTILLMGISYRSDVGDTRYSPAQLFVESAKKSKANVICHDYLVRYWAELDIVPEKTLPSTEGIDAIVFAMPQQQYSEIKFVEWLDGNHPLVFDANRVLSQSQLAELRSYGCCVGCIGRPDIDGTDGSVEVVWESKSTTQRGA